MGIREPATIVAIFFLMAGCGVLSAITGRSRRPSNLVIFTALVLSAVALGFTRRIFGPLVMVPAAVAVNATAYAVFVEARFRVTATIVSILAIAVPFSLEIFGVIAPSYRFGSGAIEIVPHAVELPKIASLSFLLVASAVSVVLGTLVVGHIRDRLTAAERRVYLQAWHLREMVPGARPVRPR